MPLGWLLPNDGYGAGYGQTETLDGNIQNLKNLADYANKNGVEIGLWTQSDLHPKEGVSALLQRDIVKEVRDAGVRVLKTDVAWVGAGYSFGLNGVADVAHIMPYYGNNSRPFIISLDGWAGTQRYASIWSGDQNRRCMGIYPFPHSDLYRFWFIRPAQYHLRYGWNLWRKKSDHKYPGLSMENLHTDVIKYGWLGLQ